MSPSGHLPRTGNACSRRRRSWCFQSSLFASQRRSSQERAYRSNVTSLTSSGMARRVRESRFVEPREAGPAWRRRPVGVRALQVQRRRLRALPGRVRLVRRHPGAVARLRGPLVPRMSEYQYYEFVAVDRPLSEREQRELRAISSRATITSTRFANSYSYGNLKGDPAKLVERYFDAHLYLANWGN